MDIWNFILNKLKEQNKLILLIVVESNGSSPGRLGFKMAVAENDEIFGSIGGGIMEYAMVEKAKKLFAENNFKPFIKKQVHNKKSVDNQSGMICSGEQAILFYPINPDTQQHTVVNDVVACLKANCKSILSILPKGLKLETRPEFTSRYFSKIKNETNWEYHEQISYKNELYVVGGGHVSVALSQAMAQLGFYVTVFDDREELNTMESNIYAHRKQLVDYEKIEKYIPEADNVYVVIMTFQHISDQNVLQNLIRKRIKYIGLMGSKSKVQKLFKALKAKGYLDKELEKVHSPIGISIKSETPEEIAISIAAEIISVKNKKTS